MNRKFFEKAVYSLLLVGVPYFYYLNRQSIYTATNTYLMDENNKELTMEVLEKKKQQLEELTNSSQLDSEVTHKLK